MVREKLGVAVHTCSPFLSLSLLYLTLQVSGEGNTFWPKCLLIVVFMTATGSKLKAETGTRSGVTAVMSLTVLFWWEDHGSVWN